LGDTWRGGNGEDFHISWENSPVVKSGIAFPKNLRNAGLAVAKRILVNWNSSYVAA